MPPSDALWGRQRGAFVLFPCARQRRSASSQSRLALRCMVHLQRPPFVPAPKNLLIESFPITFTCACASDRRSCLPASTLLLVCRRNTGLLFVAVLVTETAAFNTLSVLPQSRQAQVCTMLAILARLCEKGLSCSGSRQSAHAVLLRQLHPAACDWMVFVFEIHSCAMKQAIHTKSHAKIAAPGKRRSPSAPPLRMMAVRWPLVRTKRPCP